ncbi:o-succinylbenzoate synthase [Actinophytocola algeriensis]|uniref:o-succinylbenzoate synthase n=1 Tax=Actinophytocola algeriensis TaxID=1768010 RepID=A0A7W7VBY2_9PSEU|nr:o-succinylbenzoate synthase [Actinophytocola algeriensis]MBB4904471.1 O-succinylbenzoate synthase [Actinophytocola algeriensis]MBE1476670.1 O-succinylbenzoate synthase [Actinophytocola algeriensis]
MKTMIDFGQARVYAIPMVTRFRGIDVREGVLIEGPAGWGDFCAFPEYDDREAASWLTTAIEACTVGWPDPVRGRIPVNATVPAVGPDLAHRMVTTSGCATVKVKVADGPLAEDIERLEAVRDALPHGQIRVDANGAWDVPAAVAAIPLLDRAASGLEYVEQPCPTVDELAQVRRKVDVRIAADESIRRAEDPMTVAVAGAADIAVIKATPLGGVRRALRVAEACGLPCVVSSALETSVGLSAGLALAGALPELDFACGLGTLSLLDGDVVGPTRALTPVDGYLPVAPVTPTPDPALLDRYELRDPDRVLWWRDRLARLVEQGRVLA